MAHWATPFLPHSIIRLSQGAGFPFPQLALPQRNRPHSRSRALLFSVLVPVNRGFPPDGPASNRPLPQWHANLPRGIAHRFQVWFVGAVFPLLGYVAIACRAFAR